MSSGIYFGSQLIALNTNDISMAFDGVCMGGSGAAGYHGSGDLLCKARPKVKAAGTQWQ